MGRRVDEIDRLIGERVRMARQARGRSQTDLGKAVGVTFQQVQKYENGVNRISASRLLRIAETLGLPVAAFFEEEEHAPPPETDFHVAYEFARLNDPEVKRRILALIRSISRSSVRQSSP
jgi:transcriptional regulator with XRE-family HTH domain